MKSELSLYGPILDSFEGAYEYFKEVRTHAEDKNYQKSIDLVFRRKKDRTLTAVEVKLSDWKRAIKQAALNTCYCHYSYIAIPYRLANRVDKGLFQELGIGLMCIKKDKCKVIIKSGVHTPLNGKDYGILYPLQCSRRETHRESS